ncbi:MAG: hypothetical protein J1E40_09120 [Oscillospiraceae bacterium]|nr:hypothetical protein [Oscillospiraceae bacterium]
MSFNFKKAAALTVAAAAALSLTACGKDTSWGATIDDRTLRAGIMIYYQSSAVSEAYSYRTDGDTTTSVLDLIIEEQPARNWINAQVEEDMREYAAVESKFDELGIVFENNEVERTSLIVDQWWEYLGDYYEDLGVSKQSYYDVAMNSTKRSAIFDHFYGENGEMAVSDDEVKDYLKENYARIKYIQMDLKDGEGNILKTDGKAEIKKMAEGYIERAKAGESFEAISDEYDDYYSSLTITENENEESTDTSGDNNPLSNPIVVEPEGAETSDTTGEESDVPNYGIIISKDSVAPSSAVIEKAFEMANDEYAIVEEYEVYYLVYKMDLFADEDYFENNRNSVVHTLKDDEFNDTISGWTSSQKVVINTDAVDRYKLEKHIEEA